MASVIVTRGRLVDIADLEGQAGQEALKAGMIAFGEAFHNGYVTSGDPDALIDAFIHVLSLPDFHVYAISPEGAGRVLLELKDPEYSEDETQILFKMKPAGGGGPVKGRKFRLNIRDDKRFRMNVSLPLIKNTFTYLSNIVTIIQGPPPPPPGGLQPDDAKKFLLATSLISRCK